ncbi:hypothetical protein GCM10012275_08060 [Longimycelium tulufanense]|uniref:Uncharacterized protein n=1 Tax=Longimycelium tulufanense TaxID=907463 RepID=A0A8J3FU16_9PSEU|nr:hypothetical protein [Longimycelium tulufanense]GGM39570.1 hypothetical protein GCM10012275_08060 [Longimycelium tulufanense]
MTQPNKARLKLETLRAPIVEAAHRIEFQLAGEVFSLPPVELWPDEALEAMPKAGDEPDIRNMVTVARHVLGDDYPRFRNAGGRAMDVFLVLAHLAEDQGVTPGE